jgi:hypothetical protein
VAIQNSRCDPTQIKAIARARVARRACRWTLPIAPGIGRARQRHRASVCPPLSGACLPAPCRRSHAKDPQSSNDALSFRSSSGATAQPLVPFRGCRRAFPAAVRSWALNAVARRQLDRRGDQERRSSNARCSDAGSDSCRYRETRYNALPCPPARFLVEVPRTMIEVFVRLAFIRSDQQMILLRL